MGIDFSSSFCRCQDTLLQPGFQTPKHRRKAIACMLIPTVCKPMLLNHIVCLAMQAAQVGGGEGGYILENNSRSSQFAACCEADVVAPVLLTPCTELCKASEWEGLLMHLSIRPTHQNRPCPSLQKVASRTRSADRKPCAIS